jgi:hypothetical protein
MLPATDVKSSDFLQVGYALLAISNASSGNLDAQESSLPELGCRRTRGRSIAAESLADGMQDGVRLRQLARSPSGFEPLHLLDKLACGRMVEQCRLHTSKVCRKAPMYNSLRSPKPQTAFLRPRDAVRARNPLGRITVSAPSIFNRLRSGC